MQAIILAAGMGKRLGHLTSDNTKCMVKVNGTTLIERMLGHLSNLDLKRIVLVIGYKGENVKQLIGNRFGTIPVTYVSNPIYDKTNNIYSLSLAKDLLLEDDTLLVESDLIIEPNILTRLIRNAYPNLAVVAKFESWMDGTVVSLDDNDNILTFVPKKHFRYADIASYFKTVNIYKFSKEFSQSHYVPFLDAYCKALGNNEYYEQVLRVITLLEKPGIKALRLDREKWYEIDDIQDLDNAETIFADAEHRLNAYTKRGGGYWRYPELIDFSNPGNYYFPTTGLKNELSSNLECLIATAPSDSTVNRLIAAKNFAVRPEFLAVASECEEIITAFLMCHHIHSEAITDIINELNRAQVCGKSSISVKQPHEGSSIEEIIEYYSTTITERLIVMRRHNFSGKQIAYADMLKILGWTKSRNTLLIVDESCIDFADDSKSMVANEVLADFPNLLVLKNIAISHGVQGLRVVIAASSDVLLMQALNKKLPRYSINSLSEFYMQIFGKYEQDYIFACNELKRERNKLIEKIKCIEYLEPLASESNFILCQVKQGMTATDVANQLLSHDNILVGVCQSEEDYNATSYIRVAVRQWADHNKLINALQKVVFSIGKSKTSV